MKDKEEDIWMRKMIFCGGEEKRRRKKRKIFGEGKSERSLPDGSDKYTFTT